MLADNAAFECPLGRLKSELFDARTWLDTTIEEFSAALDTYIQDALRVIGTANRARQLVKRMRNGLKIPYDVDADRQLPLRSDRAGCGCPARPG
jgi:hypothetical protein